MPLCVSWTHVAAYGHCAQCVAINLTAVINGTAMAYERMAGNGGGVVINIASMAGIVPVPLTPGLRSGHLRRFATTHLLTHVVCRTVVVAPLQCTRLLRREL